MSLTHMDFVTGQTTGIALLVAHVTGLPFPAVYFSVTLPILGLAWHRMSARFALKTFDQTAGLAALISDATGWGFGPVFFAINLPFHVLGYLRMGWQFTLKTFLAVALLSALSLWFVGQAGFATLNPWVGAVLFGFLSGPALLALFRRGASLDDAFIEALMLQDRFGWRAGGVQLGFDAVLFTLAFAVIKARLVLISFLGTLVVNLFIAINHRPDRYVATCRKTLSPPKTATFGGVWHRYFGRTRLQGTIWPTEF